MDRYKKKAVVPTSTLLEKQIVWGRCPVRLDIAGGWSDTPPFCFEHGGSVLNIAVETRTCEKGENAAASFLTDAGIFETIL